jgi:diguanylate cyclase (GGDEF)-like protein
MFGKLFGSKGEKELSKEASAELFKPAVNSSHDAIIVIKNRETILFTNHIMKKLHLIKNGSELDDLQDHMLFYTPVTKSWSPLEILIEYHDKHNAPEPTIFVGSKIKYEREIDGLSMQIRSATIGESGDIYHLVTIHNPLKESSSKIDIYHNPLTGLPNQNRAFADIAVLTANVSGGHHFALMIIEIDNFTKLRSILGYNEMNNLVVLFANRLKELGKEEKYSVYHLMHENFLLIIHGAETSRDIYEAADHINAILEPLRHKSPTNKNISFSAGVSKFPQNGTLETLLDSAYNALNEAEERGEGQLVISTSSSSKKLSQREVLMSGDIKEALQKRQIQLYFQPIYDQPYHKIAGAEVLIRWLHPEKGMIMPDSFIPLAEKSGLIVDISVYVLSEALKQLKNWKTFGFKPIELAVNLSAKDLESDEFLGNMKELLGRYDISPFKLKVEVTEHASMMNPEMTHKKLLALKEMGLKISLDDFGTGYSSFAYLADFPIDSLKIDKGFIQDLSVNEKHQNIVESMVKLAHTLGMNVIAEGVERENDVKLLMGYGTDFFQGYYFSKPIPLLEFQHLMNQEGRG